MDLTILSLATYILFVLSSLFKKGPVSLFFKKEEKLPPFYERLFFGIAFLPLMGVLFNILGYIGKFILLTFDFLQFWFHRL